MSNIGRNTSGTSTTRVTAEYIWVNNNSLSSKSRTIEIRSLDELEVKNIPKWSHNDMVLTPLNIFNCPFRGQNGILVYCITDNENEKSKKYDSNYFAIQEYYIINPNLMRPYGFTSLVNPDTDLEYVSKVGLDRCYGRKFSDLHYKLCLATGIKMTEMTNSNSPSKWSYKIQNGNLNDLCVHLWMSRYILHRVGESCNVIMSFNPTLDNKYWNSCTLELNIKDSINIHNGNINIYDVC